MFTEKTLGKIELLKNYLSEKLPNDPLVKIVLNEVISDSIVQKVISDMSKVELSEGAKKKTIEKKKYSEQIDLSQVNKGNFQNLVNKRVETKKWDNSTILNKATYDKSSKVLTVYKTKGVIKEHYEVPVNIKESLFNSGKPGKFYNSYVVKKYKTKDVSMIG